MHTTCLIFKFATIKRINNKKPIREKTMTSPKCLIHYIICIASLMLTMGNSFARANTATCKTHLLVVGGSTSDNLDTCENLISKNIYKVNDWFVF